MWMKTLWILILWLDQAKSIGVLTCLVFCFIQFSSAQEFESYDGRVPKAIAVPLEGSSNWYVVFRIEIPQTYPQKDYVNSVRAIDQTSNTPSTDPQCIDGTTEIINSLITLQVNFEVNPSDIANSPCFVQSNDPGIKLRFQTFQSTDASNPGQYSVVFDVTLTTLNLPIFIPGTYATPLPTTTPTPPPTPPQPTTAPAITLSAPTITFSLKTVPNDGFSAITTRTIGQPFRLLVEMGTTPYKEYVDVAGMLVHSCYVATDVGMSQNREQFIDIDSCLSPGNKVFSSSSKNSGFVQVAANSGKTGSSPSVTKHYAAISMSLEATAILVTSITASSTLYFQCSLKPCYDDASGQCGGNHCDKQQRKKRDVHETGPIVRTQLTLMPESLEDPVPCHETMTFKGTVGALGTTAIVLFFAMIFSYVSFKKAEKRHKGRKSDYGSSMTTATSDLTLDETLSSCSSNKRNTNI